MKTIQAGTLNYPTGKKRFAGQKSNLNRFAELGKMIRKNAKGIINSYNTLVPPEIRIKSKKDLFDAMTVICIAFALIFPPIILMAVVFMWRREKI